jgi:hypothetical protein
MVCEMIQKIFEILEDFFLRMFWGFTGMPYPYETYKILIHPEDSKLYRAAINRLREGSKEEKITLHTGETITLF